MKLILVSLAAIAVFASSSEAQQSRAEELSEFLSSATEIAGQGWRVAYTYDTRTVTFTSIGTVKGTDYGGGLPNNNFAEHPIRISLRLTSQPTEKRKQNLKLLTQEKSDLVDRMSGNAKGWAGYSKMRPRTLSRPEWLEYLEYAELRRQVESLAMPTHTYKSLCFIDVSKWHIRPTADQSESGKQLLAQRVELLKLLTIFK